MNVKVLWVVGLMFAATAGHVQAAFVSPVTYDMRNGDTGSYNYWDKNYTGSGSTTTDGALLTGGLGDLTDGIVTTLNWDAAEPPIGGDGPYVGWANSDPTITFNFASVTDFSTVDIHFDDADGYGGVSAPSGVVINGTSFSVADPLGLAPFWASFDVSALSSSNTLVITLERGNVWVFSDEFQFSADAAAVPEPASIAMWGLGALGLVFAGRQRRQMKLAA